MPTKSVAPAVRLCELAPGLVADRKDVGTRSRPIPRRRVIDPHDVRPPSLGRAGDVRGIHRTLRADPLKDDARKDTADRPEHGDRRGVRRADLYE